MSIPGTPPKVSRKRSRIVGALPIKDVVGLVVGIASLVGAIVIALSVRELVGFPQYTVRLLAALGVSLACMSLTGFVEIEGKLLPLQVRAGGALAIFVAVVFIPPQLILPEKPPLTPPAESPQINALKALDLLESQDWNGLDELSDTRCTQGIKYSELPAPALERPKQLGRPTSRVVETVMNDIFKVPPHDPVRVVVFKEVRPTGLLYSQVNLVASGDEKAAVWALCGIIYGQPWSN